MAKSPKKSEGVQYFNQFQKYFTTPYGAPTIVTTELMSKRLSEGNTEWYKRPRVAISEMADTIESCMPLVTDSPFINKKNLDKFKSKCASLLEIIPSFNTKSEHNVVDKKKVKSLAKALDNETITQFFQEMHTVGHAMKSMAIHYLCGNHMVTNVTEYAARSCHRGNADTDFKAGPSRKSLVNYWYQEMGTSAAQPTAVSSSSKRNISELFDTEEEASEDEQQQPPKKKSKKKQKE